MIFPIQIWSDHRRLATPVVSSCWLAAIWLTAIGSTRAIEPERLTTRHLPNAWQIHERLISGGRPDGDAGFRELHSLGVRTIISVDAARPDVERARQLGMRYVHLPHGYHGIAAERVAELAKAVRDLAAPVYVHCHHGLHRSPTAASVAAVACGWLPPADAVSILQTCGTGEQYRGLYRAAATARRLDERQLDALPANFPEVVSPPPLIEAMVQMERHLDRLRLATNAASPARQRELDAAHDALLLREHLTELLRLEAVADQPSRFRKLLRANEDAARELETATELRSSAVDRLAKSCAACHREFRDNPTERKQP